jgi:signal transduction histidine kinase
MNGTRFRLVVVGVIGVLLTAWGAYGPFVPSPYDIHWSINFADQTIRFVAGLLVVAAMLVAFHRAPSGPLWKLFLLYVASQAVWDLGYLRTDLTWSLGELLVRIVPFVLMHLLLAFPTGRLTERFDRRFVAFAYAFGVGTSLAHALVWDPRFSPCGWCPRNVLAVWSNDDLAWLFGNPGAVGLATPIFSAIVLYRLWIHWRKAGPTLRRALLPVIIPAPFVLLQNSIWDLAGVNQAETDWIRVILLNPWFGVPFWFVPAGFLLGVLLTRLARGSIAELAVQLGHGTPLGGLRDTLAHALRDPSLVLAFPAASGSGFVDPQGRPIDVQTDSGAGRAVTRLERDGEVLALLIHDPAIDAEDPGLVEAVGSVARLTLENERLGAQVRAQLDEVRASRTRIVEAADEERRRIERDLHDGAQQRLVALAMRLEQARSVSGSASDLIDATTAELEAAITEVRGLARGLHPTILTEAGLAAAVEALAERTPIPVRVDIPEERFPRQTEIAAYYVVAEALTNIARYAHATQAVVAMRADGDRLVVQVSDDGQGGADLEAGSGLRGLADRMAAVGGELSVISPTGGGTMVTATMPSNS